MAEGIRRPRGQYADTPEPGNSLHEIALYVARCLAEDWAHFNLRRRYAARECISVHARNGAIVIACMPVAYEWARIRRIRRDPEPTCRGFRLVVELTWELRR